MEQRWDHLKAVGEFDGKDLCRWMEWVTAASAGKPVCVMDDEDTVLEVLGRTERAAAWLLRHRGRCFLRGLVVWAHGGWGDAAWAGLLAGNMRDGEHGGTAGSSGAVHKYDTELPTMVIGVDSSVFAEWVSERGGRAANCIGAYIARAFVEADEERVPSTDAE